MLCAYYYCFIVAFDYKNLEIHLTSIIFEVIFMLSIVFNFVRSYTPKGETVEIKNLSRISSRYVNDFSIDGFAFDLVMVIPFAWIFGGENGY